MTTPYEIPVTDPANPPLGVPGAAGTLPPPRGLQPPGSAGVDLSHLPPPAVAAVDVAPVPAPLPGYTPAPGYAPPADFAVLPPQPYQDESYGVEPIPGFTPAPPMSYLPIPEQPPLPRIAPDAPARPVFVPDEHTEAARQRADGDLLNALETLIREGGSDLHVSAGSPPMIRIDGALREVPGSDVWDRERVAAALYGLLSDEHRAVFDDTLELDFAFTLSETARFRVNYYLQRAAIGAAFRLIPTEIKPLTALGVPEAVAAFGRLPRGLVLVTGPTGSGKSTTLAALIDLVNTTRADHIVTVEDPIEFLHPNKKSLVNQREVGADTQSFGAALKHVLRQDPDVILIGELRDLETISVALTAAETGHLVFATLHTQDAGQTVDRVIDVFPPHQQGQVRSQLAATLQGVVCQTLVKKAGGKGRAVATEILVATPAIANLIREGKTYQIRSALQAGRSHGMHTMDQHLAELVNRGEVAYGVAIEKVHDVEDFKRLVHRTTESEMAGGFGSELGARG
ncbi:PilT/PilU family type 4a pilus ATPase [Pseudolysinimonas sp.]|uniref:PilT/PilU family type 4a pilus ATPase n=1 Tax=Pseudolysinimonas sp. TaxID=2680009 RepID=UPI0037842C2A